MDPKACLELAHESFKDGRPGDCLTSFDMNAMDIFNKVSAHLLAQNQCSENADGLCKYRYDDLRCAIGALIETDYSRSLEQSSVMNLKIKNGKWIENNCLLGRALNSNGIPASDQILELLIALRHIHDRKPVRQWPKELHELESKVEQETIDKPTIGK
jgi:hypothetical protein